MKTAEQTKSLMLKNMDKEVAFSRSFSELMKRNELTSDEQSKLVHWVGTRMRPIEELVEGEKLISIGDSAESSR